MKLKIAIIGLGHRAAHYGTLPFSELREAVTLCGVCETDPVKLKTNGELYDKAFGYPIPRHQDYRDLFEREQPDGIYIVTPNDQHGEIAIEAAQRGIDILCEKPLEVSLERVDAMIAAAEAQSVVFATAMQMHYRSRYHRMRALIDEGKIGAPVMGWCVEYRHPFAETKDWVWQRIRSGGAIVEKNCHHYDILDLWLQGNPTTVYASGGIAKHKTPYAMPSDIVDHAFILNDNDNGTRAMVEISFMMTQTYNRHMGVQGTEGRMWVDKKDGELIHVLSGTGEHLTIEDTGEIRGGLYGDFIDCMKHRKEPLVGADRARKSLLIPMAAEISLAEKRVVHVSELEAVETALSRA